MSERGEINGRLKLNFPKVTIDPNGLDAEFFMRNPVIKRRTGYETDPVGRIVEIAGGAFVATLTEPLPSRVEFRPEIVVREQVESGDRRIIKRASLVGVTMAEKL